MPTESEKLRKDMAQGPAPRTDELLVPGDPEMTQFLNESAPIDISIPEASTLDDIPDVIPKLAASTSDGMRNLMSHQSAAIDKYNAGTSLEEAFARLVKSNDPAAELQIKAGEKFSNDTANFKADFARDPGVTEEQVLLGAQNVIGQIESSDKELQDPDLAYVRAISVAPIDSEVELKLANEITVLKSIRNITDNMGGLDWIGAGLGLIVPGNVIKDNIDISGTAFGAGEFMKNVLLNWQTLPPERQVELFPTMEKWLFDKLDNPLKVVGVLSAMITPGGAQNLEDFNVAWAVLDVADVALFGYGAARRVATLTQRLNMIRNARRAGNIDDAAELNTSAVLNEEAAKAAGVDQVTAAGNAAPFDLSGIDAAYAEGLSAQSIRNINAFSEKAKSLAAELKGNDFFLKEGLLDSEDRAKAEKAAIKEFQDDVDFENVRVTSRDQAKTTFTVDERVTGPTKSGNPSVVSAEYELELTLNDVGVYEQTAASTGKRWIASPTVWAQKNLKETVAAAQRLDQAQAKVWNQLVEMHRLATKDILGPLGLKGLSPSGRKRMAQLDEVIRVGDEREEVYTTLELKAGINGIPGLDDVQIEAYFKIRDLSNNLFDSRNFTKREELVLKGMKHIALSTERGAIGKPLNEVADASSSLSQLKPRQIYDNVADEAIDITKLDLDEQYALGKILIRMDAHEALGNAGKFRFALVKAEDVISLPQRVQHYRIGYVPKFNINASYFVKRRTSHIVDGVVIGKAEKGASITTVRAFDNRADADAWAAKQQEVDDSSLYQVLEDRQIEKEARAAGFQDGVEHGGGGLYTGKRSSEPLLFGLEGKPLERLGAFESISRNMSSLSKYLPRNVWRMGVEQKAINTANKLLPNEKITSFSQLANQADTEAGRFLKKLHDQVEDWMGFPTKSEQVWGAMVQSLYETALVKKMPDMVGKSLQYIKHKDPIAAARAAAFHSLLGWYNPIQLWVQAQGAAVALSHNLLNPKNLALVIRDQSALAAVRYVRPEHIGHTAKAFGMSTDELVDLQRIWKKSGLEESILINADHAAAANGRGIGVDALSRAANQGLFFYRRGELFNRRTALTTAVREFKDANPGKVIDDIALKDVLARANNFMLNLGRANRAEFQKGPLGVTTQFLQVSTKTIETVLGLNGQFTRADRAKLIASQVLLYGAAGIPLGTIGVNIASQALGNREQSGIEDMPIEQRKLINEGFAGWATLAMFGIDIDIGNRSSLMQGVTQLADRFMFEESSVASAMGGAFSVPTNRFIDKFHETFKPLSLGLAGAKEIDPLDVATLVLEPISTWRNVNKAYFMHQVHRIIDSKGGKVLSRDFSLMEEIAVGIGFRLSEEVQVFDLNDRSQASIDYRRQVVNTIANIYWDYALQEQSSEGLTPEFKKKTEDKIALYMQTLPTDFQRTQARRAVAQRLQGKDKRSLAVQKFRREFSSGSADTLIDLKSSLTSNGILQQQTVPEE